MPTRRCCILILLLALTAGADEPSPVRRTPVLVEDVVEFPSTELVQDQQHAQQEADAILKLFQTTRIAPKFDNQPLDQVVQQLAKLTKTTMQIDVRGLEEEGIGADTPITFSVRKPQRILDVLDRLLQPLQLSWFIEGNVVRVTTFVKQRDFFQTRAYRIGQLLRSAVERDIRFPQSTLILREGPDQIRSPAKSGDVVAASQILEQGLLEATFGPWRTTSGEGGTNPRVVSDRLLVQQTQSMHREINALLRTMELVLSRPFGSAPQVATETDDELTELTRKQRLLETKILINFTDTPLTEVIKWLSDQLDEDLVIDHEGLTEEGIATDSAVTIQGHFTAGSALQQMLEPIQLTHEFRHGTVCVTTLQRSKQRLRTTVYDVADFLQVGHSLQDLTMLLEDSVAGPWLNSSGEGGTQTEFPGGLLVIRQIPRVHDEIAALLGGLRKALRAAVHSPRAKESELQTRFHQARSKTEAHAIERLLLNFVAPVSWSGNGTGGRGLIETAEDRIVIRQTQSVHDQIDRFLREYQQATPIGQATK